MEWWGVVSESVGFLNRLTTNPPLLNATLLSLSEKLGAPLPEYHTESPDWVVSQLLPLPSYLSALMYLSVTHLSSCFSVSICHCCLLSCAICAFTPLQNPTWRLKCYQIATNVGEKKKKLILNAYVTVQIHFQGGKKNGIRGKEYLV